MKIKFKRINDDAVIPNYAHPQDAGMDLYTPIPFELEPGERKSIPLGLCIEIPEGYVGLMWDKSGLSHKYGIKTFGGVIDAGYTGEIHVGVMNLSNKFFKFDKGHKVAQLLIQKIENVELVEVENLGESERGENRFGSTGK
jgi:dUTP pyrophosphatase